MPQYGIEHFTDAHGDNIYVSLGIQTRDQKHSIRFTAKGFEQAREHYYDNLTKHYVAIHRVEFQGKLREMALTYDKRKNVIEIITIHPIGPRQKHNRISSGRWKKL